MRKLAFRWLVGGSALMLCQVAYAGTVEQAVFLAEPQMQVKAGVVEGCGFRVKAMPQRTPGADPVVILDTTFNLYANGMTLLKGGAVQVASIAGKPTQPTNRPIQSFWLLSPDGSPTKPLNNKTISAETPGYLLYSVEIDAVFQLFKAAMEGTQLTIGARLKGEPIDRIYTGALNVSDADKDQSQKCMEWLVKAMQATLEPDEKGPTAK